MQKSIYQDETFAAYWNERAGSEGDAYKRYVLDPLMLPLVGDLGGKVILDAGCGNGYLARKLIVQNPKQIIMMDISASNLKNAAKSCNDSRVQFIEQDVTEHWGLPSVSIDVVYSNMMLNEIDDIKTPMEEAHRVLRAGGHFTFSVIHPAWDLFQFAQEQAGTPSKKVHKLGNYFRRGFAEFMMNSNPESFTTNKKKYPRAFVVKHYQRPLSDYFNQLVDVGFSIKRILEPPLTPEILEHAPGIIEYADHPLGLVFHCSKPKA